MTDATQDLLAMLTGFSAGPWRVSKIGLTNDGRRPVFGLAARIATVDAHNDVLKKDAWVADCGEREANAALIAAAPDLHRELTAALAREAGLRKALQAIARGNSLTFYENPTQMSGHEAGSIARAALEAAK